MALSKKNLYLQGISGTIGKQMTVSIRKGKTIISYPPGERSKPPTAGQKTHQDRFASATNYAKAQVADPTSKAEYESGIKSVDGTAYTVALTDFIKPPSVTGIDVAAYKGKKGELITIRAIDDFKVKSVSFQIIAADGNTIESGAAVQQGNGPDWTYKATTDIAVLTGVKMIATATDKPGNTGTLDKVLN